MSRILQLRRALLLVRHAGYPELPAGSPPEADNAHCVPAGGAFGSAEFAAFDVVDQLVQLVEHSRG